MEAPTKGSGTAALSPEALLEAIKKTLDDHKAIDITTIGLAGKSTIADYMVVATGASQRQISALSEHVVRLLKDHGVVGVTPEGSDKGGWILIDAGDVIVHLFKPEVRDFYNLEKMWGATLSDPDVTTGVIA